jgi:hypothetical protein
MAKGGQSREYQQQYLFLISPALPPWIAPILPRMALMPDEPAKLEA